MLDERYSWQITPVPQAPALRLEKESSRSVELGLAFDRRALFSVDDGLQRKLTAFQNDIDILIQRSPKHGAVLFPEHRRRRVSRRRA